MGFRKTYPQNYTLPQVDLSAPPQGVDASLAYLFENAVVDAGTGYLGHPDSVLLKDGSILTLYPEGHGKGKVLSRISRDGGKSYPDTIENPPASWANSRETPTVYRLEFSERPWSDKLILICGNPKWPNEPTTGGFNCSISSDEGRTWSEFTLFYGNDDPEFSCLPIVPMSSLTRLKQDGKFVDRWMGLFHDRAFVNYKTILTFDDAGQMHWSKPVPYFAAWRETELRANMCEVECVRAEGGQGNELLLLARSNSKCMNSLISVSNDEGETWSKPVEAPDALNGERHKAEYLPDGRLFITFRSIERDKQHPHKRYGHRMRGWYSQGWVAWVGTYADLRQGREGQYRIKLAHTYLPTQNAPALLANADTGYCGNVVFPDGTVVSASYGIFSTGRRVSGVYHTDKGRQKRKTYIVSKRLRLQDVEKLLP